MVSVCLCLICPARPEPVEGFAGKRISDRQMKKLLAFLLQYQVPDSILRQAQDERDGAQMLCIR